MHKVKDYITIKNGTPLASGENTKNWGGRIVEIYPEHGTCMVALDALTLNSISDTFLKACMNAGVEPFEYIFELGDLIAGEQRDSETQFKKAAAKLVQRMKGIDKNYGKFTTDAQRERLMAELMENANITTEKDPLAGIKRNDKVTVKYPDGKVIKEVKFKKVEKDLKSGKCTLV